MPLGFLVPLFLLGLLGLVVPVVVHLTRRRRARVVRFPSLLFLEQVPFRAESRRRIHHWLLFVIRALALALLAFAFARPFVRDDTALAVGEGGPTERVILLDRSWSMAVGDRWAVAGAAVRQATSELGPLDRVSLVVFDLGAEVPVRSAPDAGRIRAALDTLRVTDRATRYGPALKLAQTILEESELPARSLTVVSDLQRAGWTGEEGITLPAGTAVRAVAVGDAPPANLAVGEVTLTRDHMQGVERITPRARLTRVGGASDAPVEVVLEIDGREIQRRAVTLPPAGALPVVFDPVTLTEHHTRGVVRIASATPDASEPDHDNARHFVVSPGRATAVLLLDPPSGGSEASLHLREALGVARGEGFRVDRSTGSVPGADVLAGYQVVILNDRPLPGGAEGARLEAFVAGGGGLVVVAGSRGGWSADAANFLPGSLGAVQDRDEGQGGRLGYLDHDHPIFELFRGPRRGDFSTARFFRARSWQLPPGDSVAVLARFDDGSPALGERRVGEGRVLVWASTLDAYWTDLALQPVFVPLVHQLVGHASGRTPVLEAFTAGQVLDVSDARAMETAGLGEVSTALAAVESRVVLAPSGAATPLSMEGGPHFLELGERGFYEIRPPGRADVRPVAVAVNVDLAEADLAPMDPAEVEAAIGAGWSEAATGGGDALRAAALRSEEQERRQGVWRWLLAGAFLLLVAETVLSNRASRGGRHERAGAPGGAPTQPRRRTR